MRRGLFFGNRSTKIFMALLSVLTVSFVFTFIETSQVLADETQGNLFIDPREYLTLVVIGEENGEDLTGHFPSGWGIKAELKLQNLSTDSSVTIKSGTRILAFDKQNTKLSITDVIVEKDRDIDSNNEMLIVAYFDSSVLDSGLNTIKFQVDPDGKIAETDESDNSGFLKLFHPASYPNLVVTSLVVPEFIEMKGPSFTGTGSIKVEIMNIGADMTRKATLQLMEYRASHYYWGKIRAIDMFKAGEKYTYNIEVGGGASYEYSDEEVTYEVRFQDRLADRNQRDWEEILNGSYDYLEPGLNLNSPIEIGSEQFLMGAARSGFKAKTPEGYNGNNSLSKITKLIAPIPVHILPTDGHVFSLGEYPPRMSSTGLGGQDEVEEWLTCGLSLKWNIADESNLSCFGLVTDEFIDKYIEDGKIQNLYISNWPDSFLRLRWLPTWTGGNDAKVQIVDGQGNKIHETTVTPEEEVTSFDGLFDGIGFDEYYFSENSSKWEETATGDFFQYLYDGPVLIPGEYSWRVSYDVNAPDDSVTWSDWSSFVIKAHKTVSDNLTRLRDDNLSDQMIFQGSVMNVMPKWVSIETASGLVHLKMGAETTFSSHRQFFNQDRLLGKSVEVTSSVVPYISGSAYVPASKFPVAIHIHELVKPSTIYPEDGRVFQLGDLPPVTDNWANCSSVGCDTESLQSQPILEDWKVDWVDSLLRFRWLRITTEDGMDPASRMQVYDDAGALVHEAILTPGSVDPVHSGITVDETQKLGGDGRHYNEIYDHALSDMRLDSGEAEEAADQGKFYQYAYDGPVLLPGDYTWRVTYDVNVDDALAVWSDESSFSIASDDSGPGDSIFLEDTYDYDNSTAMTFRGKVTAVRPGGFSVIHREGTDTNLVNMRTDSSSIIFSPIYGLQTEVVKDSTVFVLSERVPYISGRAYVPREKIPLALEVTEHQMLSKHKRCTALSEAEDGKVAFSCADGDYVELDASDMPFDDEIVAGSSAVILVKHTTATEDCKVIANIPGDKSVVECPDGDRVQVDGTHEINKTLPTPVDAESFKLVSTATSLINRLQRFDLQEHQGQVTSGFTEAFEQAVANAPPEVKQFMELIDDLDDKVINFAESFKTGSGQMLFDPRNIEALADQIQEFADSYQRIISFIVLDALFELAKEKQEEITELIYFQSTQFISGIKDDLEKVVKLLRQANLQGAISALDEATAKEQEWEEQVVMPKVIGALALDSIETAQKELNEYGDNLPQNVKEDLIDRLNALKEEWASSGPDTQRLMDELWAAMAAAFSSDNTDGEQGVGQDIVGKAKEMILIAESDLDQYGKFMSSAVKSSIEKAVSDLRELIEPNINPDGKDEVQDAIDILASALNWSDESGDQDTEARANEIIAMAESELEQYGKYMTAETKETINKLLVDLKEISKPPIDTASSSKIQAVIDELAVALTEAASPDSESSGSDEQGPDLTEAAKEALGVASDIIGTYSDSMDPGIISAIKEHSTALQAALDNGEDMSASFEALTSILKELKDQAPKPQDGFNITIECAPQIKVGREMGCSFKNDRNPDSVTWTAAGGTPASGNGSTFQTSFAAEGTYLISLKACIGSNCIEDVQQINVVAGSSGQQGSGQSSGGETKFSVSIECASQMEVGQQLGCSFRYNRTPNTIEWSADGGTPASGSDSSFQTTFGTVGQYSISLKACMGSECITDVQAIEVVASKQSSEGK